jgi:hypothetical protein
MNPILSPRFGQVSVHHRDPHQIQAITLRLTEQDAVSPEAHTLAAIPTALGEAEVRLFLDNIVHFDALHRDAFDRLSKGGKSASPEPYSKGYANATRMDAIFSLLERVTDKKSPAFQHAVRFMTNFYKTETGTARREKAEADEAVTTSLQRQATATTKLSYAEAMRLRTEKLAALA